MIDEPDLGHGLRPNRLIESSRTWELESREERRSWQGKPTFTRFLCGLHVDGGSKTLTLKIAAEIRSHTWQSLHEHGVLMRK
jgi:hypothetical protein